MRIKILSLLVVGLITVPLFTSADTLEELQAQAAALLQRLQQLQQELAVQQGTGTVTGGSPASCPLIGRILGLGDSGDDVTRLQQFLARDPNIYPEGLVTGYYGSLTEAAVRRWQTAYNIVTSGNPQTTGYGQVGPRTAAAMSLQCSTGGGAGGSNQSVGGFIQVTPISGTAPLQVTINATVNTVQSCSSSVYTVDFGDGTQPAQITVPQNNCQQLIQTLYHTYSNTGTYQVTLSAGAHRTSAVVTVTGQSVSDSINANPTSGATPLTVTFTGVMNGSRSCNGGTYTIQFDDGQSTQLQYPADGCQPYSFSVTHQYTSSGSYSARLYKGTQTTNYAAKTVVTVSGSSSSGTYSISSVTPAYGGNPFAVSVGVTYPACAAYSIDWGDNSSPTTQSASSGCSGSSSTATKTHTYSSGGSRTITLKDGSGNVKSTASIVISN